MQPRNLALVESLFKGNVAQFKKAFAEDKSLTILREDLQICNTQNDPIIFHMFYEKDDSNAIDILSVAINFYYHFKNMKLQKSRLDIISVLALTLPVDYFSTQTCVIPYELSGDIECIPAVIVAGLENDVEMIRILSRFKLSIEAQCTIEKNFLYQVLYYLPVFKKEAQNIIVQWLTDNAIHEMKDKTVINKVYRQHLKESKSNYLSDYFHIKRPALNDICELYMKLGSNFVPIKAENTLFFPQAKPQDKLEKIQQNDQKASVQSKRF